MLVLVGLVLGFGDCQLVVGAGGFGFRFGGCRGWGWWLLLVGVVTQNTQNHHHIRYFTTFQNFTTHYVTPQTH